MMRVVFVVVTVFLFSGCGFYSGITRVVKLGYAIDEGCINRALARVSEVQAIEYKYRPGTSAFVINSLMQPDEFHNYSYKISDHDLRIIVRISYQTKDYKRYSLISHDFNFA